MSKDNKKTLLPSGFQDVLPGQAAQESHVIKTLLDRFTVHGYNQVKPPMVEFEDTLLAGDQDDINRQTLRLMDPVSRKMMGIRADITPQISRIAAMRFRDAPRPLRLSYAGQVLRVQGEGLYADRQLAQSGIELIGSSSLNADIEAILLALNAAEQLGISGITIDFSIPRLSHDIMNAANIDNSVRDKLYELIEAKDIAGIKKIGTSVQNTIIDILNGAGDATNALTVLQNTDLPESSNTKIKQLSEIVEAISEKSAANITIDPLERRGFEYHTGISFSLFSKETSEEIGRGGRYVVAGTAEDACGFTLSINALLRALPAVAPVQQIFIPLGTADEVACNLRKDGFVTVCGLDKTPDIALAAKHMECSHYYDGDKVIPL